MPWCSGRGSAGDARHRPPYGGLDEQRMRDELREGANDEVRAAFLIDAIAEKEKVEVSDADWRSAWRRWREPRQIGAAA